MVCCRLHVTEATYINPEAICSRRGLTSLVSLDRPSVILSFSQIYQLEIYPVKRRTKHFLGLLLVRICLVDLNLVKRQWRFLKCAEYLYNCKVNFIFIDFGRSLKKHLYLYSISLGIYRLSQASITGTCLHSSLFSNTPRCSKFWRAWMEPERSKSPPSRKC